MLLPRGYSHVVHTQAPEAYQFTEPQLPLGLEHHWLAAPVHNSYLEHLFGADF